MFKHIITFLFLFSLLMTKSEAASSQTNSGTEHTCTSQVKVKLLWTTVWETEKQVDCTDVIQPEDDNPALQTHILIAGTDIEMNCNDELDEKSYVFGAVKWCREADDSEKTDNSIKAGSAQQTNDTGGNQ